MDAQIKHNLAAGREYYQAGEYELARPHLEAVRDAHDDFADVHNMLGFIHYEQGRPDDACREFERALKINPRYTEAALNLSVVYNELGRYDEGRKLYEQVHNSRGSGGLDELEPMARGKIANMHRDLGDAYSAVGLLEHAIKEYRKALRICPTFVDIRTKLANGLRDMGRYDDAIDEFQAICDLSPDYIPGRTHYGVMLWRQGRIREARVQWKEVLDRDANNRSCQVYMSMTEGQEGDEVIEIHDDEIHELDEADIADITGDDDGDDDDVRPNAADSSTQLLADVDDGGAKDETPGASDSSTQLLADAEDREDPADNGESTEGRGERLADVDESATKSEDEPEAGDQTAAS